MSLEKALEENTAVMRELIAAMREAKVVAKVVEPAHVQEFKAELTKALEVKQTIPVEGITVAVVKQVAEVKKPVAAVLPKETVDVPPAISSDSEITLADIGRCITRVAKVDRERVVRILGDFGVKSGSALKPEQYADFVKAIA